MRLPWSSAPARVIIVGLMPGIGRVSASSEACHSAPYGRMYGEPGPHRGRLAEIDAVEPGQEVDHLAPDAAGLDADAGIMAVDRRRVGQVAWSPRGPSGPSRRRRSR